MFTWHGQIRFSYKQNQNTIQLQISALFYFMLGSHKLATEKNQLLTTDIPESSTRNQNPTNILMDLHRWPLLANHRYFISLCISEMQNETVSHICISWNNSIIVQALKGSLKIPQYICEKVQSWMQRKNTSIFVKMLSSMLYPVKSHYAQFQTTVSC